jgi:hypothetical protein
MDDDRAIERGCLQTSYRQESNLYRPPIFMNTNKLKARWSKGQKDIIYYFPHNCDGVYLNGIFTRKIDFGTLPDQPPTSFLEELERRGYDIKTLKFEICLTQAPSPDS